MKQLKFQMGGLFERGLETEGRLDRALMLH